MNTIIKSFLLIALVCLSGCVSGTSHRNNNTAATAPVAPTAPAEPCRIAIKFRMKYDPANVEVLGSKQGSQPDEGRVLQRFCNEACRLGADLVNILEEKQPDKWSSCYRAKVEFVRFKDRDVVKKLYSDISYDSQFVHQRVQEAKQRDRDEMRAAIIRGAIGGAVGGAIGAAAAGR